MDASSGCCIADGLTAIIGITAVRNLQGGSNRLKAVKAMTMWLEGLRAFSAWTSYRAGCFCAVHPSALGRADEAGRWLPQCL